MYWMGKAGARLEKQMELLQQKSENCGIRDLCRIAEAMARLTTAFSSLAENNANVMNRAHKEKDYSGFIRSCGIPILVSAVTAILYALIFRG